jgi:hypothetical protein
LNHLLFFILNTAMFYLLLTDTVQYISGSWSWVEVDVFVVVSAAGHKLTTKCIFISREERLFLVGSVPSNFT